MFCSQCGVRVGEGARFCFACGAPVLNVPLAESPERTAVAGSGESSDLDATQRRRPIDRFAWADAALSLVMVAVIFVAVQPGVDKTIVVGVGLLSVLVAHVTLIVIDYARNARTHERFPNVVVGVMLPPVYFGWRSVRFRYVNGWLMVLLWCVALFAQAFASGLLLEPTLSPRLVTLDVADQMTKIAGQPVTVDCQGNVRAQPGLTFRCSGVTASGVSFPVVVVVTGSGVEVIGVPIFVGGVKPS